MKALLNAAALEAVEKYLIPLRRYLLKLNIKLENQLKARRVAWLIGVREYLRVKEIYFITAEEIVEYKIKTTDKLRNTTWVSQKYKKTDWHLVEQQRRMDRLDNWEMHLVDSLESIEFVISNGVPNRLFRFSYT